MPLKMGNLILPLNTCWHAILSVFAVCKSSLFRIVQFSLGAFNLELAAPAAGYISGSGIM